MGEGRYDDGPTYAENTVDCPDFMDIPEVNCKTDSSWTNIKTDSSWTNMRCQRCYGCIECRSTMVFLGNDPNDKELFQCQNKNCSMHMKVLLIAPKLVQARILAP